jgi:hypothetical protein
LNKTSINDEFALGTGKHKNDILAMFEGIYFNLAKGYTLLITKVFHQLHCLNNLRKFIYRKSWNYSDVFDDYHDETTEDFKMTQNHLNHCILSLKENIQCHSDVSLALFKQDNQRLQPWAAYSAPQKCRKFDLIQSWVRENSLGKDKFA